jgi:UV DNA damage endonuclease
MIRLGLCCLFRQAPIKFRTTTAKALSRLDRAAQLAKVSALCLENSRALLDALDEVQRLGIGAFRVASTFFPLYTHPDVGYQLDQLPQAAEITATLAEVKERKDRYRLRLSFHPDQFTLLSSPRPEVTAASLRELAYQAQLAELIGAEVINIHGGGAYGDKPSALMRLEQQVNHLPEPIRSRLTLENDDQTYTLADLLPLSEKLSIPLVYDVHHHRCNPDGLSIAEATEACLQSWSAVGREAYFHISSPKHGWNGKPKPHADFIDRRDFPVEWLDLTATIDVEAKAKEPAVLQLQQELNLPIWRGKEGANA